MEDVEIHFFVKKWYLSWYELPVLCYTKLAILNFKVAIMYSIKGLSNDGHPQKKNSELFIQKQNDVLVNCVELAPVSPTILQKEVHGDIPFQYPLSRYRYDLLAAWLPISCHLFHHRSISRKVHSKQLGLVIKAVLFNTIKTKTIWSIIDTIPGK